MVVANSKQNPPISGTSTAKIRYRFMPHLVRRDLTYGMCETAEKPTATMSRPTRQDQTTMHSVVGAQANEKAITAQNRKAVISSQGRNWG
jgi:hypothetical protein